MLSKASSIKKAVTHCQWLDNVDMHMFAKLIKIYHVVQELRAFYLRNRSALAVNCCIIVHCLDVSCKEDQITSAQRE